MTAPISIPIRKQIELLHIEDNVDFAANVELFLADAPLFRYEITHVTTMKAGLDLLSIRTFDMTLLDLVLPNGQGVGLIKKIRQLAPHSPLVVYTGYNDYEIEADAIRESATEFFFKREFNDARKFQRIMHIAMVRYDYEESLRPASEAMHALGGAIVQTERDVIRKEASKRQ